MVLALLTKTKAHVHTFEPKLGSTFERVMIDSSAKRASTLLVLGERLVSRCATSSSGCVVLGCVVLG